MDRRQYGHQSGCDHRFKCCHRLRAVVTKDIPDGVIAAGNPCKVIRPITEKDKQYWLEQVKEFEADTGEQVPGEDIW